MPIEKHQQVHRVIRDARTKEEKRAAFLSGTGVTLFVLFACIVGSLIHPSLSYLAMCVGLPWWLTVFFNRERRQLPLFLPQEAGITDFNDKAPGVEGDRGKYVKADGFFYMGNLSRRFYEIWMNKDLLKRHIMLLGTTGSGKTETLMGFFANALLTGSGIVFSDAKGTKEQVSSCASLVRRFGRDDDFFVVNYITGGQADYGNTRERFTNTANPIAFANADQITQIFGSFLPTSSGDNQTFQDRAIAMMTAVTPALTDLRDNHKVPLGLAEVQKYTGDMRGFMSLARDKRLHPRSRESLRSFMAGGLQINLDEFDSQGNDYKPPAEATKAFGYASQYFVRAMTSLVESYRSIYLVRKGEVNYKDAVYNRRIVIVALPATEKSPQELENIAKINVSNIRGAVASAGGGRIEGWREDTIDNLPTKSLYPGLIILDEYGYQKTEGFHILMAQARGLNFSITVAGQDFSNFMQGDHGSGQADAMQGNAVMICMGVRNIREIGSRIAEAEGEVDVAIQGGVERDRGLMAGSYTDSDTLQIIRRKKIDPSELTKLNKGQAIMIPGGGLEPFQYNCWSSLPKPAKYFEINRYLAITDEAQIEDVELQGAMQFARLTLNLVEGRDPTENHQVLDQMVLKIREALRNPPASRPSGMDPCAAAFFGVLSAPVEDRPASPIPPATADQSVYDPGIQANGQPALPRAADSSEEDQAEALATDSPAAAHTPLPAGIKKGAWTSDIAPVRVSAGKPPKDYSAEITERTGGDFFDMQESDVMDEDMFSADSADEIAATVSSMQQTLSSALDQYDQDHEASTSAQQVANSVRSATTFTPVDPTPRKHNPEDLKSALNALVARNGGSANSSGVKSPKG